MKYPVWLSRTFGPLAWRYRCAGYPLLPVTRLARYPLRAFYHLFPAISHDYDPSFKSTFLLKAHDLLVRELPDPISVYGGRIQLYVNRSIYSVFGYYAGEIEHHLVLYVQTLLRPGFTMIDVGGHHGLYSLIVARELTDRKWHGEIHAFEPAPDNRTLLSRNVQANNLQDMISIYPEAVSDHVGEDHLFMWEGETGGNTLQQHKDYALPVPEAELSSVPVALTTLDTALGHLARLDMIKIDVQGGEPEVLAGAVALIQCHRPVILVEATQQWPSTQRIRTFLQQHDYHIHGVNRKGCLVPAGSAEAFISWDWVAIPRQQSPEEELNRG